MPAIQPHAPTDAEQLHQRLIMWGSGLGFAGMLASLAMIERAPSGRLALRWSWVVIPLVLFGFGIARWFWSGVFRPEPDEGVRRRRMRKAAAVLFVLGACAFLYPMRFVEPARRADAAIGLSTAIVVLSGFGWLIWKTISWMNELEPKDGESE